MRGLSVFGGHSSKGDDVHGCAGTTPQFQRFMGNSEKQCFSIFGLRLQQT